MKTIKGIFVMALLIGTTTLFAQKVEVKAEKSVIEWLGKKVGGQHDGSIQLKSGEFMLEDDRIVSGNFIVDMTSIVNYDLKNETYNQKLVDHLKSDDFFGVAKYPTAKFVVTESTPFKDGKAMVTGSITIKENTERISFEVVRDGDSYMTKLELDRSKFDVRYGSKTFFANIGDKAIDDIFTLDINFVVE
jgi:polyisoprenoid-binding protein YceI